MALGSRNAGPPTRCMLPGIVLLYKLKVPCPEKTLSPWSPEGLLIPEMSV